ncbi:protein-export chaperone SecB [Latilactobacillus sakei]|uniref:protein-export chaperone SecB n=1 Tax=Latilactobacillus sakei TaxID=1599 RepID=UPI00388A149F
MSVLEFKGYTVNSMKYSKNDHFSNINEGIRLEPQLSAKSFTNDSDISVNLMVNVGSTDNSLSPFYVECEVEGKFVYNSEEDANGFGKNTFVRNNCVAILYPYVRAIVGTLVSSSNEFPGYYMPTINVSKALSKDAE